MKVDRGEECRVNDYRWRGGCLRVFVWGRGSVIGDGRPYLAEGDGRARLALAVRATHRPRPVLIAATRPRCPPSIAQLPPLPLSP